jgi:MFS family permease
MRLIRSGTSFVAVVTNGRPQKISCRIEEPKGVTPKLIPGKPSDLVGDEAKLGPPETFVGGMELSEDHRQKRLRQTAGKKVPYPWELVIWFWLAFFFNQADRQVFNVVLPNLKAQLALTDVQAGLVASVFTACLALMVPFAGYAGDAFSKKWIIVGSVFAWSLSTLLTGFSTGLVFLIVVRSVATAVGESFYAPAASALIGDYHKETRALALAIHQTSVYAGVVASGGLAGYVADRFGWRASFWVFGAAGTLLGAILCRQIRDSATESVTKQRVSTRLAATTVLRTPTLLMLAVAFACVNFVNIGYLTWMPTYLHERFHLSLANAGFSSMFYHHLLALLGLMTGGRLSDRHASRRPKTRLEIQAAGLLLGAPFLCLLGLTGNLWIVYAVSGGFGYCRGLYDSNIYAGLYEVITPRFRASAAAFVIAFGFAAGAVAPALLGVVKGSFGLAAAFSMFSVLYVAAAIATAVGVHRFFRADHARAWNER